MCLVFAGIGGFFIVSVVVNFRRARESASWPQVQGKVIASEVTEGKDSGGRTSYSVEIVYEYKVASVYYKPLMHIGPVGPMCISGLNVSMP